MLAFNCRTMARKLRRIFFLLSTEMRRLQANHLWENKQFFIATDEASIPDWDANWNTENPSGHMEAEQRKNV